MVLPSAGTDRRVRRRIFVSRKSAKKFRAIAGYCIRMKDNHLGSAYRMILTFPLDGATTTDFRSVFTTWKSDNNSEGNESLQETKSKPGSSYQMINLFPLNSPTYTVTFHSLSIFNT